MAFSHLVEVRQAVIATTHDVQSRQVPAGELHRPEKHVTYVGTQNNIFPFANLTTQTHEDFFDTFSVNSVLKYKKEIKIVFRVVNLVPEKWIFDQNCQRVGIGGTNQYMVYS